MALDDDVYELAGVDQMLGPEVLSRPLTALFELDAQEISAVPENAIPDRSEKLAIAIVQSNIGAGYDRIFNLEANSGKGNIFQIGDAAALHA